MNMFFSARRKDAAEYDGISQCSLKAAYDSTENHPRKIDITFTAEADFCGIIKIAFSDETGSDGNARFFMPGFMYGTNRGEYP
ncbi:MAG: hypothetical protein K6G81_01655 [Lachnospiraceae bacterium]|nr:hypothetical protein [Lachnospiraceae bacterium]